MLYIHSQKKYLELWYIACYRPVPADWSTSECISQVNRGRFRGYVATTRVRWRWTAMLHCAVDAELQGVHIRQCWDHGNFLCRWVQLHSLLFQMNKNSYANCFQLDDSSGKAMSWWSRFDLGRQKSEDFSSLHVQAGPGAHSASFKMSTGDFPGGKDGQA